MPKIKHSAASYPDDDDIRNDTPVIYLLFCIKEESLKSWTSHVEVLGSVFTQPQIRGGYPQNSFLTSP